MNLSNQSQVELYSWQCVSARKPSFILLSVLAGGLGDRPSPMFLGAVAALLKVDSFCALNVCVCVCV